MNRVLYSNLRAPAHLLDYCRTALPEKAVGRIDACVLLQVELLLLAILTGDLRTLADMPACIPSSAGLADWVHQSAPQCCLNHPALATSPAIQTQRSMPVQLCRGFSHPTLSMFICMIGLFRKFFFIFKC